MKRKEVHVRLKLFLKDVLESAVVALQNGVLGRQVERKLACNGVLEAASSESSYRLI